MEKKEAFKQFVKSNPSLLKYVKNGEMNWQKFYEMYDLYGEDNEVWNDYLKKEAVATTALSGLGIAEFAKFIKNVDLDGIQTGIENIQRVIGVIQDLGNNKTEKQENKPRPLYKHFED